MIKNTFYNSINLFVEQTIKSLSSNMYKEINKNDYENVIIRHWAGGQIWNERYFEIPLKK